MFEVHKENLFSVEQLTTHLKQNINKAVEYM